ncbi:MAG TPA: hypothetical protein VHB50_13780 [Bryobacteraceae bacterium]|nr:hypothetical protein [Bryobacteraceae bacterium]
MSRRRTILAAGFGALAALAASAAIWLAFVFWPRGLPEPAVRSILQPVIEPDQVSVQSPGFVDIGDIAAFDDELFAFLMFDHYRSVHALRGRELFLASTEESGRPLYRISIRLPSSLEEGIQLLATLRHERLITEYDWRWVTPPVLARMRRATVLFTAAWSGPAARTMSRIDRHELQAFLRRFIRFKSITDPRIAHGIQPMPSPLSKPAASRLAANMIDVADFYHLPLDLLLGIGAMENNYMDIPGDLENTAWKRRPEKGDIVIRRRRGKVLVRNDSRGVWQITRESLRYAHRLYLADKRDYSVLPERLRPPEKLDPDNVSSDVLTTYAGLLLRDLLDRFHGDVAKAAGAYNGGPDHPNDRYAAGVEMVAAYARRILDRAAARNAAPAPSSSRRVP